MLNVIKNYSQAKIFYRTTGKCATVSGTLDTARIPGEPEIKQVVQYATPDKFRIEKPKKSSEQLFFRRYDWFLDIINQDYSYRFCDLKLE